MIRNLENILIYNKINFRQDSVVSDKINYDLLKKMKGVQEGLLPCNELIGCNINTKTTDDIPQAIEKNLLNGNA